MQRSNYRIFLDIRDSHGSCVLDMKQTDTHRRLRITLTEGGKHYPVAEGCYPIFTAKKPDGTVIYNLCQIHNGDVIYDITPQTTAAPGLLACEIRLLDAGKPLQPNPQGIFPEADAQLLTSAAFGIRVHPTVYNENDTLASTAEVSALSGAVLEAKAITQSLMEARNAGDFDGISASHHWDGTVLTITSGSGTSSADLRGPKGETGQAGPKGDKGDPGQTDLADHTVGSKAWSSQAIIDRLCPAFSLSGTLLHCHPVEAYPMSVNADAYFSYLLTVCGKNLYNKDAYPLIPNNMIRHSSGTFYPSDSFSATEDYIPAGHLRGQTLSIRKSPGETNYSTNAGIAFYNEDKQYISGTSKSQVTVPENASYLRFSILTTYAAQAQLELGSQVTDHEPYRGKTYHLEPDSLMTVPAISGKNTVFAHLFSDSGTPLTVTLTGRTDPLYTWEAVMDAIRKLGGTI